MTTVPRNIVVSDAGPGTRLAWAAPGNPTRAKQARMLEIDEEAMLAWLTTMHDLVDRDLPDAEFTLERMKALKQWETDRKRAQARLHYQYDPNRRRPALVDRDTKKQLAKLREKAPEITAKLKAMIAKHEAKVEPAPVPDVEAVAEPTPAPEVYPVTGRLPLVDDDDDSMSSWAKARARVKPAIHQLPRAAIATLQGILNTIDTAVESDQSLTGTLALLGVKPDEMALHIQALREHHAGTALLR